LLDGAPSDCDLSLKLLSKGPELRCQSHINARISLSVLFLQEKPHSFQPFIEPVFILYECSEPQKSPKKEE
jgi:hypothetical protein